MQTQESENKLCYVNEHYQKYKGELNWVRNEVCQNLDVLYQNNGFDYCILHYPNLTKSQEFNKVIGQRIQNQENDFRGVWFPEKITFKGNVFQGKANFDYTVFNEDVNFDNCIFESSAYFGGTVFAGFSRFHSSHFKKEADFEGAKFIHQPQFERTIFNGDAFFHNSMFLEEAAFHSVFHGNVKFNNAKFIDGVDFSNSLFTGKNYFNYTIFLKYCRFKYSNFSENSQTFFSRSIFTGNVNFSLSTFNGYVHFENELRYDLEDEFTAKNFEAEFKSLFKISIPDVRLFVKETEFDFRDIRLSKTESLIFSSVALAPSWFIKIDVTKIIFIDIYWINAKTHNEYLKVEDELELLEKRGIENNKQLLKITYRQLAENAENNNRFEESSNFRRMAFETEWLEKKEKIKNWFNNLLSESEKLKRRFGGSTDEEDKPIPPTNSFGILRRSGDFIIHFLYRITSFYGESWSWAFTFLLILILFFFPMIYSVLEFQVTPNNIPLGVVVNGCKDVVEELKPVCKIENRELHFFSEAIPHSLATTTLQNVEYRVPRTTAGYIWTILEKIFAPLQAALLALAIRRKFMR